MDSYFSKMYLRLRECNEHGQNSDFSFEVARAHNEERGLEEFDTHQTY